MVYESDFYTTRRPYRQSPSISSYTISGVPTRQVRVLPGLGKVHVTYSYDRVVPYVGHKRLTVVTAPPKVFSTRPSVLQREFERIENKMRPWNAYSATNRYLNSDSAVKMLFLRDPISGLTEYRVYPTPSYLRHKVYKPLSLYCDYYFPIRSLFWNSSYWPLYRSVGSFADECPNGTGGRLQKIFDDETRLIRAQTASLLKRIHNPVPRVQRYSWPLAVTPKYYDDGLPARLSNDNYIHKLLITSSRNPRVEYTSYFTEPVRKYIGQGHLSCISYAGERAYNRRPHIYLYEDPLRNDIQLLSYYINKFKQDKAITGSSAPEPTKVPLSPARPSRKFTAQSTEDKTADEEMRKLREARAARLAFINEEAKLERTSVEVDDAVKAKKKKEEERLAEEKALAEEQARQELLAKKEEAARRAELARQEDLAAQAAAERAAELERQAELAKQEELAKQAEIERARKLEEERLRQEEERRRAEEAKAEEERKQLERLEELARQAEEEREAELARQAEELAELARQEAELAEQAQKEAELAELARQEEELAELARQEAELAELERKEKELAEQAEQAREEAEAARKEAELADLAKQEAELAEQAELDTSEAEAEAIAAEESETEVEAGEIPLEEESVPVEETTAEEEVEEEEEDEDARQQREMDELVRQKFELAELERQQAELDALDAEAKALACDDDAAADDDEEPAIAEDTPVPSDVEE
ncbi:uncharacterized protein isoform X4 [Leptinotarsa decemlineata]|uniref:uncharacterized protein isoform X4 n=1 Tax=Leptinotarsa decemlineata TaxID=7539 RepID=UPI003D30D3A8